MLPPLKHMSAFHSHPETTLYLTLVFELRGDTDQYMYSIDRCYTSLTQANDRLKLLSRCNTDASVRENIRAGLDPETGCHWCTWSRSGSNAGRFRFYAEVKRVIMQGSVRRDGPSEAEEAAIGAGLLSMAERKYSFEHKKDLAGHVWAVATHLPDRHVVVNNETGKPITLPWALESVHEASGNAMGGAKRLWRDHMVQKEGPFDRLDLHYGYARYLLVPLRASLGLSGKRLSIGGVQRGLAWNATAQIRVERIKVISEEAELLAMFAPAQAILYDKPFRPLREKSSLEGGGGADVRAELLDLFDAAGENPEDLLFDHGSQAVDLSSLVPPPAMREVSLMSLQEAYRPPIGREDEEQIGDISSLASSSIRLERRASTSSSQKTFRPGLTQECGQLATVLSPAPERNRLRKTRPERAERSGTSRPKSMIDVGKHLYNSMVRESSRNKLWEAGAEQRDFAQMRMKGKDKDNDEEKKHNREPTIYNTVRVPLETPGQVALAAHQTLFMASMLSRG